VPLFLVLTSSLLTFDLYHLGVRFEALVRTLSGIVSRCVGFLG